MRLILPPEHCTRCVCVCVSVSFGVYFRISPALAAFRISNSSPHDQLKCGPQSFFTGYSACTYRNWPCTLNEFIRVEKLVGHEIDIVFRCIICGLFD